MGVYRPLLLRNAQVLIPLRSIRFERFQHLFISLYRQTFDHLALGSTVMPCQALQGEVGGHADPGIEASGAFTVVATGSVGGLSLG